ncbi:hypothetical protein EI94DRAFT_1785585 [Lactarius quietus]|nr:hypothetical protein EI94DRAFT_1785585 [Lactarius quietus]
MSAIFPTSRHVLILHGPSRSSYIFAVQNGTAASRTAEDLSHIRVHMPKDTFCMTLRRSENDLKTPSPLSVEAVNAGGVPLSRTQDRWHDTVKEPFGLENVPASAARDKTAERKAPRMFVVVGLKATHGDWTCSRRLTKSIGNVRMPVPLSLVPPSRKALLSWLAYTDHPRLYSFALPVSLLSKVLLNLRAISAIAPFPQEQVQLSTAHTTASVFEYSEAGRQCLHVSPSME